MKQKIVYLNEKHCKKIKFYTQKYKDITGEFVSMGKFVENLIDTFCHMNLQIMLGKYEERRKEDTFFLTPEEEQEIIDAINEEYGHIKKELKMEEK